MRLKEIKPGMVIHCKNDEEKKALLEEAERLGYCWLCSEKLPTEKVYEGNTIHFYAESEFADFKHITWSDTTEGAIEFSDLILPVLTAEEAIKIYAEICIGRNCDMCPINVIRKGYSSCNKLCFEQPEKVVEFLEQWKSGHEKKEPEIETEWFWQGKIFKISEDGCYHHIKDGTGFYDTGCEFRESAEEYMEDELKEYCKTHDGKFIAVVDHVCRVKAVE